MYTVKAEIYANRRLRKAIFAVSFAPSFELHADRAAIQGVYIKTNTVKDIPWGNERNSEMLFTPSTERVETIASLAKTPDMREAHTR